MTTLIVGAVTIVASLAIAAVVWKAVPESKTEKEWVKNHPDVLN